MAVGLVNCGRGVGVGGGLGGGEQGEELLTEQLEPLLHDNQHDRIAAGLAMGVALLFTDTQARGESLLRDLLASSSAYARVAGVLGLGLAFAGRHQNYGVVSEWARRAGSSVGCCA